LDCALTHNSAPVKDTAHERISSTPEAAAEDHADRAGGRYALWMHPWQLSSRHHVIALFDQAIVSGASFASTVIVARWTVPDQLGTYSIGISVLLAALAIQGAVISLPYTIQCYDTAQAPEERAGSSLLQSCLLSAVFVLILAASGAALRASGAHPDLATMALALAATIPFALLREFARRVAFAHLRLAQTVLLDGSAATIQLGTLHWIGRNGWMSAATASLALGVGCAPAAAMWVYVSRSEITFRRSQLGAAISRSWGLGKWLLGSQIALLVQGYAANWLLAVIGGTVTTGIYAASMSIVSVANPLILGLSNILMPRAVLALNEGGPNKLWRQSVSDAVLLGLTMAAFCVTIMMVGQNVMQMLYHGAAFEGQQYLLTILAAAFLASSLGMPASNALASMERTREIFRVISGVAVLTVLLVWPLTTAWGLVGAASGVLLGNIFGAAGRWIMFYAVLRSRGASVGAVDNTDASSRFAQATRVLREFAPDTFPGDWSVVKLDKGEQADVFMAEPQVRRGGVRVKGALIIKLYKSADPSQVELARLQFEYLSLLHAMLNGRMLNGWLLSTPVPLYLCKAPLAHVMTMVPGRTLSWHLRDGTIREEVDALAQVVVAAMRRCWAAGQSHGDLNVDNIILDVVARKIAFVDPLLPSVDLPCCVDTSGCSAASIDLAYLLFSAAIGEKRDFVTPGVRSRKLIFAERVLREFVETITECEDRLRLLDEIHGCARLHLKTIDVSWSLQGHWRRFLRQSAARDIDKALERLKKETISPPTPLPSAADGH